MKQRSWIVLSGFIWFFAGMSLLFKGLRLITEGAFQTDSLSYRLRDTFGSSEQAATSLMAVGLMIGFVKGRFVLAKTVRRVVARIVSLPTPIRFKQVYAPAYWILIASMMSLGMIFPLLPIAVDTRGTIDVAIGSALINGAILYFRAALQPVPAL